ncbi:MAG: repeat protein [Verrucomicrobiales bacterium]|nr:repeat protein [Verrucomicrobiales bacterium]
MMFRRVLFAFAVSLSIAQAETVDYSKVDALFDEHCLDCHSSKDPDANLVLENFESLMKGGETGAALVAGKSEESLLVKMLEGKIEKEGKKKIMPPGKRKKLSPADIALIKAWIDAGAHGPAETKIAKELVVPKIALTGHTRNSVFAMATSTDGKLIAIARFGEVELLAADTLHLVRKLTGLRGDVNAVAFSADGSQVFAASGENGLFGEVKQWKVGDGTLVQTLQGHKDILYSLALSPDGKILATGGYDQKIILWDTATGKEIKTLKGHNGCVFGLAFRPDGKILASASGDRTVKLWNVSKGERTDTLSQPTKEVYCVAWSGDGKKLYAGGLDNRIRIWEVSESATENTDPILESKFAHEGSILRLVVSQDGKSLLSSSDDRTVKLWSADPLQEQHPLEQQSDWPAGLVFVTAKNAVAIGCLDGSLGLFDLQGGKALDTKFTGVNSPAPAPLSKK